MMTTAELLFWYCSTSEKK